jgi:transposase
MVSTMSGDGEELVKGLVIKPGAKGRRTYSKAGKRALARRCIEPGVSVARMALLHGVNANLLRRWVVKYAKPRACLVGDSQAKIPAATLLPVTTQMPEAPRTSTFPESYIEITLSAATVRVRGSVDAAVLDNVIECLRRRS